MVSKFKMTFFQDGGVLQRRGSHDNQMGSTVRAAMAANHQLQQKNMARPPRRGISVPDLDSTTNNESSESPITVQIEHEEEMVNTTLSPR